MLKDITLGQFFPGNTPIHRLDPRTKLLCVILYIVALFNAKGPLTYGIMIAVLAVCILLSKVEWKALTRGLKPVYIIVAFTAIREISLQSKSSDAFVRSNSLISSVKGGISIVSSANNPPFTYGN